MDWSAIGTAAVGLGVLIGGVYNGWQSAQAKRMARRAETNTRQVHASLHTPNGGSHVKDTLDLLVASMGALREDSQALREDFREHTTDSRHRHERTEERLYRLERPDAAGCAVIPLTERTHT